MMAQIFKEQARIGRFLLSIGQAIQIQPKATEGLQDR
jgi:hypothetical protein